MLPTSTIVDVPLRTDEGGVIRVRQTRVTLQTVIADFQRGASPEEIVYHYPALNLSDVYVVVGYYLQRLADVDAYIRDQRILAENARRDYEAQYPQDEFHARILAKLEEQRRESQS
jgi:uncharacterized protein (DUF433 family)